MISEAPAIVAAKVLGAMAGAMISIAYVLPKSRREAWIRLSVGFLTGLIFGGTVGAKIADFLGLLGKISALELSLMGATFASLYAWWWLGLLKRISENFELGGWLKNTTGKKD